MSHQITPKVFPHLDSHVRPDGRSKFFIRVSIGKDKRLYPINLNGQKELLMKKEFWANVIEDGKKTREKYIRGGKGNPDHRKIQRALDAAMIRMETLIKELGGAQKTITHNVLERLWHRRGIQVFSDWAWEFSQQYVKDKNLSAKTLKRSREIIRAVRFYEAYAGALPLQAITADWFKEFQLWIYRPKTKNDKGHFEGFGWSSTNGCRGVRALGTMFKHAKLEGEITANPYREFVDRGWYKRYDKETITFLEEDEIERMYQAFVTGELKDYTTTTKHGHIRLEGKRLHDRLGVYLFTIFTGLRYQDVKKVAEGHKDVTIGRTHLSVIMSKSKREGSEGKMVRLLITEKMRTVANLTGEGPVFNTRIHNSTNININLRKILGLLGIDKHMTFHDLRRTFATSLLSKGARMKVVSTLIGHESITTTEKHYGKVVNKIADETMALWDKVAGAFTDPAVRGFVEDVFVMLQDNPDATVRKRLLDKIEALSELLQLSDLETVDNEGQTQLKKVA